VLICGGYLDVQGLFPQRIGFRRAHPDKGLRPGLGRHLDAFIANDVKPRPRRGQQRQYADGLVRDAATTQPRSVIAAKAAGLAPYNAQVRQYRSVTVKPSPRIAARSCAIGTTGTCFSSTAADVDGDAARPVARPIHAMGGRRYRTKGGNRGEQEGSRKARATKA